MSRPRRRRPRPSAARKTQIGNPDLVPDRVKECMPTEGVIYDYVCWASQETYADPLYHLACILPVAAYQTATRGWGGPWEVTGRGKQCAIQSFIIGGPASAKSTCMRKARDFHIEVMQRERNQLWRDEENPWLQAEGTVPGLLEAIHDLYDEELDVSPAIFNHEEVSSLLEKGGVVVDTLMQLFDTVPRVERHLREYRRMRQEGQRPASEVICPAVSGIFCGTMNSAGATLTARHFEGGLVSRSLWFTGEADLERYFETGPDDEGRRALVTRWTHLGPSLSGHRLGGGASMVQEAQGCKPILQPMFEKFVEAAKDGNDARAAQLQRGLLQARVVAALYALSCSRVLVTPEDVRRAVKLVELSQAAAEVLAGVTADDMIWRFYQKAVDSIRKAGEEGIPRWKLNKNRLKVNAGTMGQVVDLLKEDEDIFVLEHDGIQQQGRKGLWFYWKPVLPAEKRRRKFKLVRTESAEPPEGVEQAES